MPSTSPGEKDFFKEVRAKFVFFQMIISESFLVSNSVVSRELWKAVGV